MTVSLPVFICIQYSLTADELANNGHFPRYLCVCDARRMIEALVQTQKYILNDRTKPDAIWLGSP